MKPESQRKTEVSVIDMTESVCPHCLTTIPAKIIDEDGRVYMVKTCPEHGDFKVYLWPDADHYRWCATFDFPATVRAPQRACSEGCPQSCGLCSSHRNWISLAEVEITYKCNMRCPVCFMSAGERLAEPSFENIVEQMRSIYKRELKGVALQITGGEPTVRLDLFEIIAEAHNIGFSVVELNTNGIVLGEDPSYAQRLVEAGCSNVYLQFDGVTDDVTARLRRVGVHDLKLRALENCRRANLPVILAPAIVRGVNDSQLAKIIDFAMANMDVVQGVSFQPAFVSGRFDVEMDKRISMGDIVSMIETQTGGRIRARDFYPLNCVSPLCDCSTYLVGDEEFYTPLSRSIDEGEYRNFFKDGSTQGSTFVDVAKRKYHGMVPRGMPILIMCFMDAWTFDVHKVQRCNLGISTADGRMVPFCSYHLTDTSGNRLYPYPSAGEVAQ